MSGPFAGHAAWSADVCVDWKRHWQMHAKVKDPVSKDRPDDSAPGLSRVPIPTPDWPVGRVGVGYACTSTSTVSGTACGLPSCAIDGTIFRFTLRGGRMRRIYFLVPDFDTANRVTDELLLARISERQIHVVAREGAPLGDLPKASFLQTSDVIPAIERGLAVGGVTGTLAGIAAVSFPPAGLVLGGGAVLATALLGSGVGAWLSSMIGVDVVNSQIRQFESAVQNGNILFMVDVPRTRVEEIETLVKSHHPEADIEGTEPHIPAFP